MRLTDKTERWGMGNKTFEGKYKSYVCHIYFSSEYYSKTPHWYFVCSPKEGNSYNSLWDNKTFKTKEECHDACVEYINSKSK